MAGVGLLTEGRTSKSTKFDGGVYPRMQTWLQVIRPSRTLHV